MSTAAGVPCPSCPAGPWTEPGNLAGHLVNHHSVGAAEALREARRLIIKPPSPPMSDVLHRAGVIETTPDPKEAPVAKKKRAQQKCRMCGEVGHNAKSCRNDVDALKAAIAKAEKDPVTFADRAVVERPRPSNGDAPDLVAQAQANARAMVKSKIGEELVMARAYVAELDRLANA